MSDTIDTPFVLRAGSDMNFGDDSILELYQGTNGSIFKLMYAYADGHASRSFEDGISGNVVEVTSSATVGGFAVAKVTCWASGSTTKGLLGVKADRII